MRILLSTGSAARYMAPPRLGDEQVTCGPDWTDRAIGGQVTSLATPGGDYDLAAVAARLPADQQPEMIVCLVDSAFRALPRKLRSFRCPKVLLVADTHHLDSPLTGMIRYAQSEPFDRIVFLYDRHQIEFFREAGLQPLFWFPGLTFPHSDAAVLAARQLSRQPRIAFVGQTGICHPRRTQLLSNLCAGGLPLESRQLPQGEGLDFYGSSLIGFNASLNGDLNLRIFEVMSGGAMLLTDELGADSGLAQTWRAGSELATYRASGEMVEKARWALDHPAEAGAIGRAGARWFDEHFSEAIRRRAFYDLVFDGRPHPAFPLPAGSAPPFFSARPLAALLPRLIAAYEFVQELHRNLDRVTVALDETVPEEFARMCATLPRLTLLRGLPAQGVRADFLAVGRVRHDSPALARARHIWCWQAGEADRIALARRCAHLGLALADAGLFIFSRKTDNTHRNFGAIALVRLEQGTYQEAENLARAELARNPKCVDSLLVMLELAQHVQIQRDFELAKRRLHLLAPHHPRLREILAATPAEVRGRLPVRLVKTARGLFDRKNFKEAAKTLREAIKCDTRSGEAQHLLGLTLLAENQGIAGLAYLAQATLLAPDRAEHWHELGLGLRRHGAAPDALGALLRAADLKPENFEFQFALGEAALAVGHGAIAAEALGQAVRLRPGHRAAADWGEKARTLAADPALSEPRDLLLTHAEVTGLHGTGVLLKRFFSDARRFITLRSRSLYQGRVELGGIHFSLDLPGLPPEARRAMVRRLLAPYRIRRIVCVPYYATDFLHAQAAFEATGAPLCTYAMDDQSVHAAAIPREWVRTVFAASALRLVISPEMAACYAAAFGGRYDLLPPIVANTDHEAPNHWVRAVGGAPARRCALVGNIWSASQFEQTRRFVRAAGLTVDWFGNSAVSWLPQDPAALERDGIHCRGFVPEERLAKELAGYPFAVIPSGSLDGTEDNEWLTRLSIPSRIVFILTKTRTPMLILGSPETAAARFIHRLGLGASSNYDIGEAPAKIDFLTAPESRSRLLENARRAAPCFLLPETGEWIWRSLAAGRAEPAPFDFLFAAAPPPASDVPPGLPPVSDSSRPAVPAPPPLHRRKPDEEKPALAAHAA